LFVTSPLILVTAPITCGIAPPWQRDFYVVSFFVLSPATVLRRGGRTDNRTVTRHALPPVYVLAGEYTFYSLQENVTTHRFSSIMYSSIYIQESFSPYGNDLLAVLLYTHSIGTSIYTQITVIAQLYSLRVYSVYSSCHI
jgi:hypothetical protein